MGLFKGLCGCMADDNLAEYREDSRRFSNRVAAREVLAKAMASHFDLLLREIRLFEKGEKKEVEYPPEVWVVNSLEEANRVDLTFDTAFDTTKEFVGFCMAEEGRSRSFQVLGNVTGTPGSAGHVTISGRIESGKHRHDSVQLFNVDFRFFLADEE